MNITLTFALMPRERRLSLRAWSALGILRASAVGLPIAAAGIGLVIWRIMPGAVSGLAVIVTMLGFGILASPQVSLISGLIRSNRRARALSDPDLIQVTFMDSFLKFGRDELMTELPWRHVTDIRTAASCWIISIRGAQTTLVIPERAIPAGSETQVTEFLRQRSSVLSKSIASG